MARLEINLYQPWKDNFFSEDTRHRYRGAVFEECINCHLYHYAGNNPVRYVDPEGRSGKNNTDQYVIVRLESDNEPCHYMILAPGDFITADCDGAIFSSSNMIKVSAKEELHAVVNFTILGDNYPDKSFEIDDIPSLLINYGSDVLKIEFNAKLLPIKNLLEFIMGEKQSSEYDISGHYPDQKREGAPLNSWWQEIVLLFGSSQEELKNRYETDKVQQQLQQKYLKTEENDD